MKNWYKKIQIKYNLLILLLLAMPLALTYYAWYLTSENLHNINQTKFDSLAKESEKALIYRMGSYNQALLGGKGFFEGSNHVSRDEWRSYVEAVDILENFPGINGIGHIVDVEPSKLDDYVNKIRREGYPDFQVKPKGHHPANFIITYIEPIETNVQAVGLDIAFEEHRYEAATLSRDTGKPAITKRILLVQDLEKTPGFLLLLPVYDNVSSNPTVEQRRKSFKKWVYAPFIAKNFMKDLTQSQGDTLHLQIYDEGIESEDHLIYDSNADLKDASESIFTIRKEIEIMQQKWLLVWSSTEAFEKFEESNEPLLVLLIGLLFTGLFTVFLVVMVIRNDEKHKLSGKGYIIPILAFCIAALGAFYLQKTIAQKELEFISHITQKEALTIRQAILSNVQNRILSLDRMAKRWETRGGTPFEEWKADSEHYITHQPGIKAIEWVDNTYHVRWVVPIQGNESAVGLNIVFNKERKKALEEAIKGKTFTITPPLDLVQGYKAIITYSPLIVNEKFDGFIVGLLSIDEIIQAAIIEANASDFVLRIETNGKEFYRKPETSMPKKSEWVSREVIKLHNKEWAVTIYPTPEFIQENQTFLPELIFAIGLILSVMIAAIINFAQRSKEQSILLSDKEKRIGSIVNNTTDGIVTFDGDGLIESCNPSWKRLFKYDTSKIIGQDIRSFIPDFNMKIGNDLEVTGKPKNGELFPIELSVSTIVIEGKLMCSAIARDVTERKLAERMKQEFISTVSHELRTPLTSITGALSLIESGVMGSINNEVRDLVHTAHNNSKQLTLLINDILDIDKIESGNMRLNSQKYSVNMLIVEATEAINAYAEKFNVTIHSQPLKKDAYINVDETRFIQIMSNLLSNAIKFSPDKSVVEITLARNKKKIRVSVIDQGIGIPKEFRKLIFGKFTQADSSISRNKEGTGLGLNITQKLVIAMGGKINFTTAIGKGTTFYFEFPEVENKSEKDNDKT